MKIDPLDRRIGTTGGLGGLYGVLEGLGMPLPPFLTRTTGELLAPLLRAARIASPPPPPELLTVQKPTQRGNQSDPKRSEAELLALASRLIEADFGASDPDLLADNFTFTGPVVGPLKKEDFVKAFGGFNFREAMPDLDYRYRDARVCPFEQDRIWYTSSPKGTHDGAPLRGVLTGGREWPAEGKTWQSPPEAGSAAFDTEGRCVSLTGRYVMDRRMGNTGGFGGVVGLCVALGAPSPLPLWLLRTPVQNADLLRTAALDFFRSDNPELLEQ